ncbi:hypothetical protein BDV12DRAFT_188325 [Aspergillus spectabilis]
MTPLRNTILFLLAAASLTVHAERLKAVFSSGTFSTISGPAGGSSSGGYNGFAIIRENGEAIYNDGTPAEHVPCRNVDDGRTFTIEGDCWASPRQFYCMSDFGGQPETCRVLDGSGATTFIGISIGMDATCVVEFDSDDSGTCPVDDGNGPLHVTSV